MATAKSKRVKAKRVRTQPTTKRKRLGLSTIMGRFNDAEAVIVTGCTAMEDTEVGPPIITIREGLRMLKAAYNEFDYALMNMQKGESYDEDYDDREDQEEDDED